MPMMIGSRSRCNVRQLCDVQPQRRADFGRRIILPEKLMSDRDEAELLILKMRAAQPQAGYRPDVGLFGTSVSYAPFSYAIAS
jgi:hypothetical protein